MAEEKLEVSEKDSNVSDKIKQNPWLISTVVLAIALAIVLAFALFGGGITGNAVSERTIGDKAVNFINSQILQGQGTVTLDSVSKKNGLYEVVVSYQGQSVSTYFTSDGEYYLGTQISPLTANVVSDSAQTTTEVPKSDKPKVELFVMSFCPYGNRAEDTMLPVYNLLKDKVDWGIHYIVGTSGGAVQSLHGQPEVDQNEREACVLSNSGICKWWTFVNYVNTNCGSDGNCWEVGAKAVGLNIADIKSCVSSKGLSLMQAEETASNAAGAQGSPTLIINGVQTNAVYQYGNSEAYKQAICNAFNEAPAECSQALSAATSPSASGSCN